MANLRAKLDQSPPRRSVLPGTQWTENVWLSLAHHIEFDDASAAVDDMLRLMKMGETEKDVRRFLATSVSDYYEGDTLL